MALGRTERERRLSIRNFRKIQLANSQARQSMSSTTGDTNNIQQPAFTFKGLSKWSIVGLDLTDSGFSKLHSKESTFESSKVKYNLEPEKFKNYTKDLIEKVERIHAVADCTVNVGNNINKYVLKEYSSITTEQMTTNREARWPDNAPAAVTDQETADRFTDSQIKTSVLGNYIHESLTEAAKEQLNADCDQFKVTDLAGNKYLDGPSYFHSIARLVDPDNGYLVAKTKACLRNLNIKDFGYDAKKMLAEFKNLKTRVSDLGGDYSTDDQFLDLWTCARTMKEKEFNRYVRQTQDDEARKPKANRASVDEIIRDLTDKQTRMETDREWNVMSPEDTMLMALTGLLDNKKSSTNNKKKNKSQGDDEGKTESTQSKSKNEEDRFPEWKKIPPAEGESTTKVIENRTYHWCTKCRNGKGLWAMHKVHDDNFVPSSQRQNNKDATKSSAGKSTSKKVTFNTVTSSNDNEDESGDGPQIKVKQHLIDNAKSYLAQFKDFQTGGVSG